MASDTRERILQVAEHMLRGRGFSAFSYQDVAQKIGIRKASVHYHFPSKADLGVALIARVRTAGRRWSERLEADRADPVVVLDAYFDAFAEILTEGGHICAGGILGAEFNALPESVQSAYRGFAKAQQRWLIGLLERGRAQGVFHRTGEAAEQAALVAAALQGALQIARGTNSAQCFHGVTRQLRVAVII